MSSDSGLNSKLIDIATLGIAEPFIKFLHRKVKTSVLGFKLNEVFESSRINEEVDQLIRHAGHAAKESNPHFGQNLINELVGLTKVTELLYSIIAFSLPLEEALDRSGKIDLSITSFSVVEKNRGSSFLNEMIIQLKNLEVEYLNIATLKILGELKSTGKLIDENFKNIHTRFDVIEQKIDAALPTTTYFDNIFEIEFEELNELDKENNFLELRRKSTELLKYEKGLSKKNYARIDSILFKIIDSYLAVQDLKVQKEAIRYLEEIKSTSINPLNRDLARIYILLLNEQFNECLKKINDSIEEHGKDKRLLKTLYQYHLYNKEFDNALKIAEELENDKLLLILHFDSGDYDKSINLYLSLDDKSEYSIFKYYIDSIVLKYQHIDVNMLIPSDVERINSGISEIEVNLDSFRANLLPEQLTSLLLSLSFLKHKLNNNKDSHEIQKEAFKISPDNQFVVNNLIATSLENRDFDTLRRIKEKSNVLKDDFQYNILFLELNLVNNENVEKTISEVFEHVENKELKLSDRAQALLVYIRGLLDTLKFSKAYSELERLESQFSDSQEFYIARANYYIHLKKHTQVISNFTIALDKAKEELHSRRIKKRLADYIYDFGDKGELVKAIDLYEELSNEQFISAELIKMLTLMYRVNNKKGVLDKCNIILEKNGLEHEQILNLKGQILIEDDNFEAAKPIYERLVILNPSTDYTIKLATCYARIGSEHLTKDLLTKLRSELEPGNVNYILLSQLSLIFKEYQTAINDIELAMETKNPSLEVCYNYFFTAIHLPKEISLTKKQKEKLVEAREILVKSDSFFLQEYKIDIDDPEKMIEQLLEIIPDNSRIQVGFKQYQENRLPLSYLTKLTGWDIISVSEFIFKNKELKIWSSTGNETEYEFNDNSVRSSSTIVLDLLPILTLSKINYLHVLDHFDRVILHQHSYDELKLIQMRFNDLAIKGETTLYNNGTNIGTYQIDKENFEAELEKINTLLKHIDDNFELLGNPPAQEKIFDTDDFNKLESVFGKPTLSSLNLSAKYDFTFYSDDVVTRSLGKYFNVKSFDTVSLLRFLNDKEKLSNHDLNKAINNLILYGYYFIRMNFETLLYAIKKLNYIKYKRSVAPFEFLSNPETTIDSLVKISTGFLQKLWMDNKIDISNKMKWTDILFENIVRKSNRPKKQLKAYLNSLRAIVIGDLLQSLIDIEISKL